MRLGGHFGQTFLMSLKHHSQFSLWWSNVAMDNSPLVQYFSYRTKIEFISNYINYDQPLWYLHSTLRVSNDIRLSNDMIVFTLKTTFIDDYIHLGVSINGGTPSYHPFLDGIFPYKPSSYWGTPIYGSLSTRIYHLFPQIFIVKLP